jgi:uncharacterized protein (TIGR03435 family)
VASIKPNNKTDRLYYKSFANRFRARNMTAKQLMLLGWQIGNFQISGGDSWFSSQGFDIEATTEEPVSWRKMQLMFQSLLADRFKLAIHRKT